MAHSPSVHTILAADPAATSDPAALAAHVKELANAHFDTPEVQYFLDTPLTPARLRVNTVQMLHFVRNRRDCWALASSLAPLDVKRLIWAHEQDELIHDPRAGTDHFALMAQQAEQFGLTPVEVRTAPTHPFVAAALDAWILQGRGSWLEAFSAVAMAEIVNSNAIIRGGGYSARWREKLVVELGHDPATLHNENVHVAADMEHPAILDDVLARHVTSACEARVVLDAAQRSLRNMAAFRAGQGFAMRQVD